MAIENYEYLFGVDFLKIVIEWVRNHLSPDMVYTQTQLNVWAVNHGYKKEQK